MTDDAETKPELSMFTLSITIQDIEGVDAADAAPSIVRWLRDNYTDPVYVETRDQHTGERTSVCVPGAPERLPSTNFDYDRLPPDEALPGTVVGLVPIISESDGGVIAWATDDTHAMAIARALNAAEFEYETEMASVSEGVA